MEIVLFAMATAAVMAVQAGALIIIFAGIETVVSFFNARDYGWDSYYGEDFKRAWKTLTLGILMVVYFYAFFAGLGWP